MIDINVEITQEVLDEIAKTRGEMIDRALKRMSDHLRRQTLTTSIKMRGLSREQSEAIIKDEVERYKKWVELRRGWRVDI